MLFAWFPFLLRHSCKVGTFKTCRCSAFHVLFSAGWQVDFLFQVKVFREGHLFSWGLYKMSTQYLGHFGQAWEMHWTSQGKDGHAVVSSWPEWPWLCSAYVSGPLMIKLCFISFSELCPSLLPPLHYCLFPVPSSGPAVTSDITAQRLQASSQKAFCLVYRTFKIGNGANIWKSGHFTQKKKMQISGFPLKNQKLCQCYAHISTWLQLSGTGK